MKGDAEGRKQQMRKNKDQSGFFFFAAKRNYGLWITAEGGECVSMCVFLKLALFCSGF